MTVEELDTLERLLKKANDEGKLTIYDEDDNLICFECTWYKNGGLIIETSWPYIKETNK